MKIRTRLAIYNICVTATVFFLCLLTVYLVSAHVRTAAFYRNLKGEAVTKAHLFLNSDVDAATMQAIYLNNRNFIDEVEVAVYSTDHQMLYHDAIQIDIIKETPQMLDSIALTGEMQIDVGDYRGVGLTYNFDGHDYIVTAAAYDAVGHDNLMSLRSTLVKLFVIGLVLIFIAGYFLAKMSLKPIRQIVHEAEEISASNISQRLILNNEHDELGELCTAFNRLLSRLEASFEAQRQFVSNVSHELRTPLAALTAELDLALQRPRDAEHYRHVAERALDDAHRMTRLIDGLLNLAKADYGTQSIKMQEIRLDELLLDVREYLLKAHPDYTINLIFDQEEPSDDRFITVRGNLYLLTIALSNLIENNCKYSEDHTANVQISYWGDNAIIRLSDAGDGMSDVDKDNLFTLFYRGEGEHKTEGHGIGMALAQKIVTLHGGKISVNSLRGEGTTFIVQLPHIPF